MNAIGDPLGPQRISHLKPLRIQRSNMTNPTDRTDEDHVPNRAPPSPGRSDPYRSNIIRTSNLMPSKFTTRTTHGLTFLIGSSGHERFPRRAGHVLVLLDRWEPWDEQLEQ